jgi:hypothetical protein
MPLKATGTDPTPGIDVFQRMFGAFGAGPAVKNVHAGSAAFSLYSYWSKLLGIAALTVVGAEFKNTKKAEETISKVKTNVMTVAAKCFNLPTFIFLFLHFSYSCVIQINRART